MNYFTADHIETIEDKPDEPIAAPVDAMCLDKYKGSPEKFFRKEEELEECNSPSGSRKKKHRSPL